MLKILFMVKTSVVTNIKNCRAVSLVEILIALIIGATAFFPIIKLFQQGIKDSIHSTSWTQAREIAKNHLDAVLMLPFQNIIKGNNLILDKGNVKMFPRTETIKGADFKTECVVHDLTPLCSVYKANRAGGGLLNHYCISGKLKAVTITVKWKGVGRELDYSLVSFKADLSEGTKTDMWQWGSPEYLNPK